MDDQEVDFIKDDEPLRVKEDVRNFVKVGMKSVERE